MSIKGQLQEHFQKLQSEHKKSGSNVIILLPKYKTERTGGQDHYSLWTSTIIISDGRSFTGNECAGKKAAEVSAASKTLEAIKIKDIVVQINKTTITPKSKAVILVDLENKQKAIDYFVKKVSSNNVEVIGFYSTGHSVEKSIKVISDPRVSVIEVPSTRKDGADIGLVFYTGVLLCQTKKVRTFVVVSNDHFSDCLADVLNNCKKMGINKNIICYSVNSMEDALKKLS